MIKNYQLYLTETLEIVNKRYKHYNPQLSTDSPPPEFEGHAYAEIIDDKPSIDPATQVIEQKLVDAGGGVMQLLWVDRDKTQDELDAEAAALVPESVTNIQMRDALIDAGMFGSIDAAIDAMPDGNDKLKMQQWWNTAPVFRRDNPRIAAMSAALGLDDATVDNLFIAASQVL